MPSQQELINRLCKNLAPGRLEWIGLRSARKGDVVSVAEVMALQGLGLEGDHRTSKRPGSGRQVTIISSEFIGQIAGHLQRNTIDPALLRRNLVVSGLNLNALRYQKIQIGDALLEAGALCHPCSRMEQALGDGAIAAMLGYGGLCAKVIRGGRMQLGDPVSKLDD